MGTKTWGCRGEISGCGGKEDCEVEENDVGIKELVDFLGILVEELLLKLGDHVYGDVFHLWKRELMKHCVEESKQLIEDH